MGSIGAMSEGQSADRYDQKGVTDYVPEGVEAVVPYKGTVAQVAHQLVGGIRAGMGYTGSTSIRNLQERAQFIQMTEAGNRESHPHSIKLEKNAPNYAL